MEDLFPISRILCYPMPSMRSEWYGFYRMRWDKNSSLLDCCDSTVLLLEP